MGPGSITCDANSLSIHDKLLERFPLLATAGGYELSLFQRGREDQGFCKLHMPYSPSRLKETADQAIIYVRPLQRNLDSYGQEQDIQSDIQSAEVH